MNLMKHSFVLFIVLASTSNVMSQDRKCVAFETEKNQLGTEDDRLKSVASALRGKPEIPKDICKWLGDQIKFNKRVVEMASKCVDEGFQGFKDLSTQYEQENQQVYMKSFMQQDCQRFDQ